METARAKELLVDYFNGHLSPEERTEIEQLIKTDPDLSAEAQMVQREMHLFHQDIDDPYEDARLSNISEDVMKKIRAKKGSSFSMLSPAWRSYLRAAAVVILITFGLSLFFYLRPILNQGSSERVVEMEQTAGESEMMTAQNVADSRIIRLSLATENPKVKIYWTLSEDFELISQGE